MPNPQYGLKRYMTLKKVKYHGGIGIDIEEIDRFRRILDSSKRNAFLKRIFTPREIAYCERFKDATPHFAGNFAVKEAVIKALGGHLITPQVEIRHLKDGAPQVYIKGRRFTRCLVSITHTTTTAGAVALHILQ